MKKLLPGLWIMIGFTFLWIPTQAETPPTPGGTINGTVTTSDGKAAASVTVQVKNKKRSILTDDDGHFTLRNISPGTYTLEISLGGYETVPKALR